MSTAKYIFVLIAACILCTGCKSEVPHTEPGISIDRLNREAFELRYKDIEASKNKAYGALQLIEGQMPHNYDAKAQAWNSIAYSHFLTSYFDSTRMYLGKVRGIDSDYENKQIEQAIANITEARLYLRECKYAEAFIIYDSTLTIFNGGLNRLRYDDRMPMKRYDHLRYNWARSSYLIGNAVLGYYYRDTALPIILESLDQIERNAQLHIDTTQLSILHYTYAGSYEKAIPADVANFYLAFDRVKKGLDLMLDPASRNDYHLANYYQITGSLLRNRGTRQWLAGGDSTEMKAYIADFKREYLIGKYHWDEADARSDSLPLLLLKKSDALFKPYGDPYQTLASSLHIGSYYLSQKDTVPAWRYYMRGIGCDSIMEQRKGYARIWRRQLYGTLMNNLSEKNTTEQVKEWFDIYARESAVIAENTKRDYNTQRGKAEAEALAKRSLTFVFVVLVVCGMVIVLLYYLNKQHKRLRKAHQEVQFMQKKLIEQKRIELLTHVVRGISHELSQPLGSITQTLYDTFKDLDTLKERKGSLSDREYDTIVENLRSDMTTVARGKDTISELVNSFRNTIRENTIDPETEFDLRTRLDDIAKVVKPTIKSNINLAVVCEPGIVVRSFPLLFTQVVTNLISNANQHAFPDSDSPDNTIRIVARAVGKDLIFQCIDNGIGIPENELDTLCQPFVSKKQNNLGLGLSLVKNIVEQHMNGEIAFSSDKGLTVTVTIPDCIVKQ